MHFSSSHLLRISVRYRARTRKNGTNETRVGTIAGTGSAPVGSNSTLVYAKNLSSGRASYQLQIQSAFAHNKTGRSQSAEETLLLSSTL